MAKNEAKKHHYVPQFYMRGFACVEDDNKIMVLERHGNILVADRKSIKNIGYELHLHDYLRDGESASIEGDLNKVIETPFSQSPTWLKISSGSCASLDESDRLPLYGFARHLQLRNFEMLRFGEAQKFRHQAGDLEDDLTGEEREMWAENASQPGAVKELFLAGVLDPRLPDDASAISVIVCQAPAPLRSSTNPTLCLSFPGHNSVLGAMLDSLRTWWLALDRHWGVLIILGGQSGFSVKAVEPDFVRVVNRYYLAQFLQAGARYLLADDHLLGEDLKWQGFITEQPTARGSKRWRREGVAA